MCPSAQVSLTRDGFEAVLSDQQRISRNTIEQLADALHSAGVSADATFCGGWRDGAQILIAGQKIALFSRLRELECHATQQGKGTF